MNCCPIESWLEKNPYLSFRLLFAEEKVYHFPKIQLRIGFDTEVLFLDGVLRAFDSIIPFLERGGKVVFFEENVSKVKAFLALKEFIPHPNIEIALDVQVARKHPFKKQQFIGKLEGLRKRCDEVHMAISEYQDLGKTILRNIQSNLLHTNMFVHGKYLEGVFRGKPVVVCGSGPSLNKEKLLELQKGALIFAAGSSISKLLECGIRVDAAFQIDPFASYEAIKGRTFPLFYQNRVNCDLFRMHAGPKIWMGSAHGWELEEWMYRQIGLEPFFFDAGWNAGMFAFHAAHFLGCIPSCIGMDGTEKWLENFDYSGANKLRSYQALDQKKVSEVIRKINAPLILQEIELVGEPVYDYLIEPLWKVFDGLYGEGVIAKMLFAKRVLQFQEKFRFYPGGALYAKETKDGISELFYETGEVKARVAFSNGVLHGDFCLFAKNGILQREGKYVQGKREGVHTIRREDGEAIYTG